MNLADCLRIIAVFLAEQAFNPCERLLFPIPLDQAQAKKSLRELQRAAALRGDGGATAASRAPRAALARALRALRSFFATQRSLDRIRRLAGEIRALRAYTKLHHLMAELLADPELQSDADTWLALDALLKRCKKTRVDPDLVHIAAATERATLTHHCWYSLQKLLQRMPFRPGTSPLTWQLDRHHLNRLIEAIDDAEQRFAPGTTTAPPDVLIRCKALLGALRAQRPHFHVVLAAFHDGVAVIDASAPNPGPRLVVARSALVYAVNHIESLCRKHCPPDLRRTYRILRHTEVALKGYLQKNRPEFGDAIQAHLNNCLSIARAFRQCPAPLPPRRSIQQALTTLATSASGVAVPKLSRFASQLSAAYSDLLAACDTGQKRRARKAARKVAKLVRELRQVANHDRKLLNVCRSIEQLLDPFAEYRQALEELRSTPCPGFAGDIDRLRKANEALGSALVRVLDDKLSRLERRVRRLLPAASNAMPLRQLLSTIAQRRKQLPHDVLGTSGDGVFSFCDWDPVFGTAFAAARFMPPTTDEFRGLRRVLQQLNPAREAERLSVHGQDEPYLQHTHRMMRRLAEYEASLDVLEKFTLEYLHTTFRYTGEPCKPETIGMAAEQLPESERFGRWLRGRRFRFIPPRLGPWHHTEFCVWLQSLPVGERADVLRAMILGVSSDAVDMRVRELAERKPSKFILLARRQGDEEDKQWEKATDQTEANKRRALLFLLGTLAKHRPFSVVKEAFDAIRSSARWSPPDDPTMVEEMFRSIEEAIACWESAKATGDPTAPDAFTLEMLVERAWDYLLGHEQFRKQVRQGKLRHRSRRVILAQMYLEYVLSGPTCELPEATFDELYADFQSHLASLRPKLLAFYGTARRSRWVDLLIAHILEDIVRDNNAGPRRVMSEAERRKKHDRIKAEEQIFVLKIREQLDLLRQILARPAAIDSTLWALYRLLVRTFRRFRRRQKAIALANNRNKKRALSPERKARLERYIEKSYTSLYRLAAQLWSSYPYLACEARRWGLPGVADCLERVSRAAVDLVHGFARGPRPAHPGDAKQGANLDARPRGLQYLLRRRWIDEDWVNEMLEPPRLPHFRGERTGTTATSALVKAPKCRTESE